MQHLSADLVVLFTARVQDKTVERYCNSILPITSDCSLDVVKQLLIAVTMDDLANVAFHKVDNIGHFPALEDLHNLGKLEIIGDKF